MATRVTRKPKSNGTTRTSKPDSNAFQWGSAGAIASAALGGAMIAVAANLGPQGRGAGDQRVGGQLGRQPRRRA